MPIEMPLAHPIRLTDDGWTTEITEQPDGSLSVVVTDGLAQRAWQAQCDLIEDAIALAYRIKTEQTAGITTRDASQVPPGHVSVAADDRPPLDPPAPPAPP